MVDSLATPMASFTRPSHYPYSFKALKDIPRRLFNPPRSQIKIGRVRSMSLTPLFEVKLADVLDGQHLPPLSRKDFEEYLLCRVLTRKLVSPYMLVYDGLNPCSSLGTLSNGIGLYKSIQCLAQTGTPYSPQLALHGPEPSRLSSSMTHTSAHLSRESLEGLPNSSQQPISSVSMPQESSSQGRPTGLSYPNPIALTKIKSEVEDMLRESLNRFVCTPNTISFSSVPEIYSAVGLAPVLVSILQGRGGRALRVAAIPIFWLGAWITIMSLHGVCILIYLAGDSRQLYPYELARPKITAPISKPQPASISYSEDKPRNDIEKSGGATNQVLHVDLEQGHMGSYSSASTLGKHSRHYSTSSMGHDCSIPTSVNNLIQQPNAAAGLAAPQRWSFDFDALPSPGPNASADPNQWGSALPTRSDRNFGSIPTFGPLTKVLSPIVTRAQWEIVVRSAIMGVVVAAILGAICLAIPARK
ncbi:hypothetical protein RHS01_07069 [Rhizoctonia solani]|uniref:RGS domain-containing protein n=1 Tax=Rhizoctonia solani TaxID=456999 RepID=A0A8H7I8D5_9AGAM|nr:hypothetical protein RHS01_07069 [Rhizoctonia solani]